MLAPLLLACAKAHRKSSREILARVEMRDAWLATLVPFAVAGLLVLVLVVVRRQRQGSARLDGLFRPHSVADVRRWWRERIAAYHQWQADRRERARMSAAIAAEQEAARIALATAAERERKPAPKIMSPDGRPILELHQRLRVQTDRSKRAGVLADITEAGLKVGWDFPANAEIPWDQVRQISVRRGRERQWAVPVGLAILGAGFLGACGWLYSEFDHSTSGRDQDPSVPLWGTLIGGLIAGAFGMIIMYALPGPRWRKLVDVPAGTATLTLSTFAARAADTAAISSAADSDWVAEDSVEAIARVLLLTILLAIFSTCSSH